MTTEPVSRERIGEDYLASLPYEPYPVQEEGLLSWFMADRGVLLCAPTGTGKTLVAHGALYEALHRNQVAYYTTPLIALTEQKFQELQRAAIGWGFKAEDVGLVTGNRRVNPNARILVVVAEILLNRLLNPASFRFDLVSAVVMDEFHSFADRERGIVWELSLSMLPEHVRLMLLSATVGNAPEFLSWLARCHDRRLELVQEFERKIPLTYKWVGDRLLNEQVLEMAQGDEFDRTTPALVFCFNREECWTVAEQLKGLDLMVEGQRAKLTEELELYDWTQGVGPKIRQMLRRGVGVHHAGMLPKYRRLVEELYERKLLSVAVCTETLAAGINLPARSVVVTTLMKGPAGKKKLIDASTAHQIFGRAGRPQYDDQGFVYVLSHEDDVRILRWQEKYDQIPEDTKDPGLLKAKKRLKKKKPTRRDNQQYWNEPQFAKLIASPPGRLTSRGPLPWRLLAYLLEKSPDVEKVRHFLRGRLMDPPHLEASDRALDDMLLALHAGGYVVLEPEPPKDGSNKLEAGADEPREPKGSRMFDQIIGLPGTAKPKEKKDEPPLRYRTKIATPTPELDKLLVFRSIHPLFGAFLLDHLGIADRGERLQALEGILGMPRPLLRYVRPPLPDELPPGPLTTTRLDPELIARGLIAAQVDEDEEDKDDRFRDEPKYPPSFADKLRMLFEATYPSVHGVQTQTVWAAGELLRYDGDFNKYVRSNDLVKQEGIVFRHVLRLILLCGEFATVCPRETTPEEWQADLRDISDRLTAACRQVDPESTDKMMEQAQAADVIEGEAQAGAGAQGTDPVEQGPAHE